MAFPQLKRAANERRYNVMKREPNGFVRRVGITYAADKVLADTKARRIFGPSTWTVDADKETA